MALGNRITTLMVPLPLASADPEERLRVVHETTARLKSSEAARAASLVIEASGWVPPTMSRVLGAVGGALGPVRGPGAPAAALEPRHLQRPGAADARLPARPPTALDPPVRRALPAAPGALDRRDLLRRRPPLRPGRRPRRPARPRRRSPGSSRTSWRRSARASRRARRRTPTASPGSSVIGSSSS